MLFVILIQISQKALIVEQINDHNERASFFPKEIRKFAKSSKIFWWFGNEMDNFTCVELVYWSDKIDENSNPKYHLVYTRSILMLWARFPRQQTFCFCLLKHNKFQYNSIHLYKITERINIKICRYIWNIYKKHLFNIHSSLAEIIRVLPARKETH